MAGVRFALLVGLGWWAGCQTPAAESPFAPDLDAAFDAAGDTGRVRVLVVHPRDLDPTPIFGRAGGRLVERFRHVPVTTMDVTREEALALDAEGLHVAFDRPIAGAGKKPGSDGIVLSSDRDLLRRASGADQVHAGAAGQENDGSGVVVAIVDSGIRAKHPDFPKDLIVNSCDFMDREDGEACEKGEAESDPYGHGTMIAGVLASQRDGLRGVAPGVRLVSARVLDDEGDGTTSAAIAAVDWIIDNAPDTGVRIISFSIGAAPYESFTTDPLAQAAESALDAGLIVVAAAGNFGTSDGQSVYGGVVSPATHPGVITVGAVDSHGTARRSDDSVASFSSRGPTLWDGLGKPDVVAPGVLLPLPARSGSTLWTEQPAFHLAELSGVKLDDAPYLVASGTSFAAPAVAGTVAMMLNEDPTLSAAEAKAILEVTASDAGDPTWLQGGAGQLNALGAVRLAGWQASDGSSLPVLSDPIEGESVSWGLTLLWDGFDTSGEDLSSWNSEDVLAVGEIDGTGILWDGLGVKYVGVRLQGTDLLAWIASGALDDATWGTGILWDGGLSFVATRTWGSGILWDGGLAFTSGRVWSQPNMWTLALVWPSNLDEAGAASPLFGDPDFSGLTDPVEGDLDPHPLEPDFAME